MGIGTESLLGGKKKMYNNRRLLRWLVIVIGVVVGLPVLLVLFLNIDGWGLFVLDLAFCFLVQASIALALTGAFLVIFLTIFRNHTELLLSRSTWVGIFLATAVPILLLFPALFHRPVDVYDMAQTIVMIIAFGLLIEPFKRFLKRPGSRLTYGAPSRLSQSAAFKPRTRPARRMSHTQRELYRSLLRKVMGDEPTALRLMDFERQRAPDATTTELLERAIDRWKRDNR